MQDRFFGVRSRDAPGPADLGSGNRGNKMFSSHGLPGTRALNKAALQPLILPFPAGWLNIPRFSVCSRSRRAMHIHEGHISAAWLESM